MTLKTNVLGYPRVGANRELKKAEEAYWAGKATKEELLKTAAEIRKSNWLLQKEAGIDLIPSNDFSFYDQTLDLSLCVGAIPERYNALKNDRLDLYFAMAHGLQKNGIDVTAMEMTKWFDTNYHYIVPEFAKNGSGCSHCLYNGTGDFRPEGRNCRCLRILHLVNIFREPPLFIALTREQSCYF
jgi:5-methyltetrahydropteroyltriglutamate--homocysteine methyltransferase